MLRPPETADSRWPHRWAWVLTCATFPLVWWGALVTSTDAGMAFRDWLTSDGHFMLAYPWLSSTGDKFVEHGHRLLAVLVGVLTIALVVATHICGARRSVRHFSFVLLAGVIAQGVLGGLRVVLDQRTLALLHGCTGPLFFALTAVMLVLTSRGWAAVSPPHDAGRLEKTKYLARAAIVAVGLTYLQLVLGAIVRHTPQMTSPIAASLFQTAVYFHVIVAGLLVAYVATLAWRSYRAAFCRKLASLLAALTACQIALGGATWLVKYGVPRMFAPLVGEHSLLTVEASFTQAAIVTSHVAVGSLILAVSAATALWAIRATGWSAVASGAQTTISGGALA